MVFSTEYTDKETIIIAVKENNYVRMNNFPF